MGITIESKNVSADLGFGGFSKFRQKVACLCGEKFSEHYQKLNSTIFLIGKERKDFFKKYDAETEALIKESIITAEIANFCYQSDCGGSISQNQAKQIYEVVKNYDDDLSYGYSGREDGTVFSDLKNIFEDCVKNGGEVKWS